MNRLIQSSYARIGLLIVLASLPLLAYGQQVIQVANVGSEQKAPQHPIDPALEIARASLLHVQSQIDDYKALFVKRTRVDGELPPLQYARVKIRNRKVRDGAVVTPMGVYLDFLKPANVKGREVIWLEGANDGNLVVHKGGMARFVTLKLDPTGYLAMRGQRYPITDIGIENLLEKIIEACERDRQYDECEVQIFRNAKVGGNVCTMVQVTHPVQRDHFDFYRARVYFSDSLNVPIRYKSWTWPASPDQKPVVQEEYNYMKLEMNVGLTDHDFDPTNPEYEYH